MARRSALTPRQTVPVNFGSLLRASISNFSNGKYGRSFWRFLSRSKAFNAGYSPLSIVYKLSAPASSASKPCLSLFASVAPLSKAMKLHASMCWTPVATAASCKGNRGTSMTPTMGPNIPKGSPWTSTSRATAAAISAAPPANFIPGSTSGDVSGAAMASSGGFLSFCFASFFLPFFLSLGASLWPVDFACFSFLCCFSSLFSTLSTTSGFSLAVT
mmetsp:Transcript_144754/g.360940  ORF Transcript_144754/g.360940 Transcript_144754/m.360940 type:complete len:216 (+) Transcript_144754:463-1110(+)